MRKVFHRASVQLCCIKSHARLMQKLHVEIEVFIFTGAPINGRLLCIIFLNVELFYFLFLQNGG